MWQFARLRIARLLRIFVIHPGKWMLLSRKWMLLTGKWMLLTGKWMLSP
jgi:hypothetical protein